ncbi:MAG: TIGR04452 family lipoprotein [Leptospira sp.]|nr:TIGR04452 family lipoprotein [Leptospira sp.]
MKIFFRLLILGILLSLTGHCLILDKAGLTIPDRITGSEAKNKIITAAVITDLVNSSILSGGRGTYVSILSLLTDKVAGINTSGYYVTSEVDACVKNIRGATGFILGSFLTVALVNKCHLKEDKKILDQPLPAI